MDRNKETHVLLASIALALLVLALLAMNTARLGSAIAREVERAQIDYLRHVGGGEPAENNALLLGHCLRFEMLKSAQAGFVDPDAWAAAARSKALPSCAHSLPALRPSTPPRLHSPHALVIVTRASPWTVTPGPTTAQMHAE